MREIVKYVGYRHLFDNLLDHTLWENSGLTQTPRRAAPWFRLVEAK
ncbi:hypothetical protein X770_30615 [Mesorhizobium sp. LSJC269B00]|nr:hypothetical protein X770_30615 [Mesorhizobium sp. LSJC269B00]